MEYIDNATLKAVMAKRATRCRPCAVLAYKRASARVGEAAP